MANITAAMVKELREMTGAGMMDCKQALNETGGDIEAAVDWLRKKGLSKAAKKSDRVAAEGLVGVAVRDGDGVVVEVNSETDFVARNEEFQALVKTIALVAVEKGVADVEELKKQHYPGGAGTVADAISNAIATIGENMTLRRAAALSVPHGVIGHYVHSSVERGRRQDRRDRGAGIDRRHRTSSPNSAARSPCMSPPPIRWRSTPPASIPPTLEREKNVLREKNAGKPAHVLDKIVESGLKTYYKEVTLVEQPYIHDSAKTVAQAVAEAAKTVGAPVALKGFVRYVLGEGVEKQEADFAAEVAAAASGQG